MGFFPVKVPSLQILTALAFTSHQSAASTTIAGLGFGLLIRVHAALQVYDSLKASGEVPLEKLAFFDSEDGPNQLAYMRYLSVSARPATAIYIADNNLSAVVSKVRNTLTVQKRKHLSAMPLWNASQCGSLYAIIQVDRK